MLARLEHPGLVPVHDVGRAARRPRLLRDEAGARQPPRRSTWPAEPSTAAPRLRLVRAHLRGGRLRARARRDPPRPQARERDGGAVRRGAGAWTGAWRAALRGRTGTAARPPATGHARGHGHGARAPCSARPATWRPSRRAATRSGATSARTSTRWAPSCTSCCTDAAPRGAGTADLRAAPAQSGGSCRGRWPRSARKALAAATRARATRASTALRADVSAFLSRRPVAAHREGPLERVGAPGRQATARRCCWCWPTWSMRVALLSVGRLKESRARRVKERSGGAIDEQADLRTGAGRASWASSTGSRRWFSAPEVRARDRRHRDRLDVQGPGGRRA